MVLWLRRVWWFVQPAVPPVKVVLFMQWSLPLWWIGLRLKTDPVLWTVMASAVAAAATSIVSFVAYVFVMIASDAWRERWRSAKCEVPR